MGDLCNDPHCPHQGTVHNHAELPGNFSIASSGNPSEDRKRLVKFLYDDVLIKAGLCPNGCGPMEGAAEEGWDTILNCEHCGFQYGKVA